MASKKNKNEPDIKTSTANMLLNAAIFLLAGVVIYLGYSVFVKLGDGEKPVPPQLEKEEFPSEVIQVEVLNGAGVNGLADRFTDFLRNNGFDVVKTGNYPSFDVNETLVIDRIGNMANAKATARALGVPEKRVVSQLNQDYFLDVSIIIGKDYFKLKPIK